MGDRKYPHVTDIKDWPTQQSIKLLWEKVFAHEDTLSSQDASIKAANASIASANQTITALGRKQVLISAPASVTPTPTQFNTQPPAPTSDNGAGDAGCNLAGPTGHVDPGLPRNPQTAGMIVCGVGNEFPALLAAVANQTIRDNNRAELLNRMIWHLNLQGFPASHYGADPASSGYKFVLLIQFQDSVTGEYQSAYRVTTYETFETPMHTVMVFGGTTVGATVTPDGGTPD